MQAGGRRFEPGTLHLRKGLLDGPFLAEGLTPSDVHRRQLDDVCAHLCPIRLCLIRLLHGPTDVDKYRRAHVAGAEGSAGWAPRVGRRALYGWNPSRPAIEPEIGGVLYRSLRHLIIGEPDTLKGWLLLVLAQHLTHGRLSATLLGLCVATFAVFVVAGKAKCLTATRIRRRALRRAGTASRFHASRALMVWSVRT